MEAMHNNNQILDEQPKIMDKTIRDMKVMQIQTISLGSPTLNDMGVRKVAYTNGIPLVHVIIM